MTNSTRISPILLKWYDKNARNLPWRIPPLQSKIGIRPDPYNVWLSEIMLQQTQVKVVKSYYYMFVTRWPSIVILASAINEDVMEAWAGLGYYSRARNLINCAKIIVQNYKGIFPQEEKLLLELPGIGSYTAAAIQSIAFNKRAIVMDGNINRIITRLFAINKPISLSKINIKSYAEDLVPKKRFGDYAQALMDLGSQICTPKNPQCTRCPVKSKCQSFLRGLSNKIPYPMEKKPKPKRYGYAFITFTGDRSIVLERRPSSGLLGGMLSFPSSKWEESNNPKFNPPFNTNWNVLNETVCHTFSHFNLELKIAYGFIHKLPSGYLEQSLKTFDRQSLPTLMRKIYDVGIHNTI